MLMYVYSYTDFFISYILPTKMKSNLCLISMATDKVSYTAFTANCPRKAEARDLHA